MGDLEVATDELEELGGQLKNLGKNLKTIDGGADYGLEELAHRKVVDAMDEFRGNWDDNRDHLADKLSKLGDLATTAAESFTEADEELAKQISEILSEES